MIGRAGYVNLRTDSRLHFDMYFHDQSQPPSTEKIEKGARKYTLICIFTVEVMDRVRYVNLRTDSRPRFDMYFTNRS